MNRYLKVMIICLIIAGLFSFLMQNTRKLSFSPEETELSKDDDKDDETAIHCFIQSYPPEEEVTNNNDESCSQIKTKTRVQTYCPTSSGDDVYLAIESVTRDIMCSPQSCGTRFTLQGTGFIGQLFRYSAPLRFANYMQIIVYNELGEITKTSDLSTFTIGPTADARRFISQVSEDTSASSVTCF
jgi:hypothetical protein